MLVRKHTLNGNQMHIRYNALAPGKFYSLQWRHNEHDDASNHRGLHCLLKHLFRRRSKKTSNLRLTGLCEGNPPVTGGFPSQRAVTGKMFPFDDVIMCHFKQMYNVIIISIMVTRAFPLEMLTEVFPKILSVINLKWFRWWLAAVRQQKFTWIIIKTDLRHNRLKGIDLSNNDLWKVTLLVPSHQWPDSVSKYICCYLCHVTGYN